MKKDIIGGVGLILIVTGVALYSRPIALILAGAMLFLYAFVTTKFAAAKNKESM